jgi:ABC-type spermidine/putrescine transport system permease subunit II
MYILKVIPKFVEGVALVLFICKRIIEAYGMRTTTTTLTIAVFTFNMPLSRCSREPIMLKGIS